MPTNDYAVLVVDDEPSVSRQLADGLAVFGFRVACAASSEEALTALEANPAIAAVISDIRMPGLDGLNLARRILRDRDDEHAVEVVVMTGHATIDDAATAVRTRVADFLRKPFRLAEAARAVGAALDRAGTRRRNAQERQARLRQLRLLEEAAKPPPAPAPSGADRDIHAISHALRTPLSAIAGGAQLLSAPSPEAGSAECMAMLMNGIRDAREAVELVEELHQAGHIQPGHHHAALGNEVDLGELVKRTARRLSPLAVRKGVALEADTTPVAMIDASPVLLSRIIDHCMMEALDWARPGAVLRASVSTAAAREWAVVTLLAAPASTEAGEEPPEGIIFDETTSLWVRTQEGLRFAIARRLLERMGGRLTSWNGTGGAMALRAAIPLRTAAPIDAAGPSR